MRKRGTALLLALLLALGAFACTGTQPTQETPAPVETELTETPAPVETEATPAPATEEYFLPKEDGCNQLTLYWKAVRDRKSVV